MASDTRSQRYVSNKRPKLDYVSNRGSKGHLGTGVAPAQEIFLKLGNLTLGGCAPN